MVNVATLRTALEEGGTAGCLLALGSCIGDLVYFSLAVGGAAAILKWTPVRFGLWLLGTGVLLTLTWRMLREVLHPKHIDLRLGAAKKTPAGVLLMRGAGLALASPTSIAWFAAVGGSVIATFGGDRLVLLPFASGFFLGTALWAIFFPYSVAAIRTIASEKLVRVLSLISAVMFVYFAFVVFINGAREFL